jgi:hypothetical protein
MNLDSSNTMDQYPCINCQQEIPIRLNSMTEDVELSDNLRTLYEINDDGFSKIFLT